MGFSCVDLKAMGRTYGLQLGVPEGMARGTGLQLCGPEGHGRLTHAFDSFVSNGWLYCRSHASGYFVPGDLIYHHHTTTIRPYHHRLSYIILDVIACA